ncbi:hypothetical protein EV386_1693 [Xylanimonas ulmi]|uniref:Methyltransferase family protein n=1 Tax=Xylanimonas ulmi TaxID=228973 RepID=A0A4Q7M1U4_9MICO|nr:hypothetical protein EV386_1693 [Xylanibacterium ulmi]
MFDALNARAWWSHNDHFHGWVVRRLAAAHDPAVGVLDVGCAGGGLLAALRSRDERGLRDPEETFAEVASTARAVLPGARVRRRLWFRYTLEWTAP